MMRLIAIGIASLLFALLLAFGTFKVVEHLADGIKARNEAVLKPEGDIRAVTLQTMSDV